MKRVPHVTFHRKMVCYVRTSQCCSHCSLRSSEETFRAAFLLKYFTLSPLIQEKMLDVFVLFLESHNEKALKNISDGKTEEKKTFGQHLETYKKAKAFVSCLSGFVFWQITDPTHCDRSTFSLWVTPLIHLTHTHMAFCLWLWPCQHLSALPWTPCEAQRSPYIFCSSPLASSPQIVS